MTENSKESPSESGRIGALRGWTALSPMVVFLLSYVAVSVYIGDFYKMPISVALTVAAVWAVVIYRGHSLQERIDTFSRATGHVNILYMIWVFVLAGAFATMASKIGAVEATVSLTLSVFPAQWVVPTLFLASCFISLAIGTSVGTVVALVPLAAEMAEAGGADVPFFVAVVLGGAFFGDNLSFISDTTIAATRSQGCDMADKFKANLWIALPAAVITLALYMCMGAEAPAAHVGTEANPWLVAPYLIVIGAAAAGINVTIVLVLGTLSAAVIALLSGHTAIELAGYMGEGIESMGSLIVVTLLSAGLLGIIRAAGGIDFILQSLTRHISGKRGAQTVIAALVGIVNLCTANNTVAIITVGGISRAIAKKYGVDPRKSASLLDSASCIVQCLIPYGAQALLAASLAGISPIAPLPYLYYPMVLAVVLMLSIEFLFPRRLR